MAKTKKDNEKPAFTVLQLVAIDETGDSYYRMRWPARHLAEQAPDWRILNLDARAADRFIWAEEADLLVVYQSHDLDLIPILKRRRAAGKKTLSEYNDNFYAPPPATPVAAAWSSPILWQSYERFMHDSDGVIVTGPGLSELFSTKIQTPIHILENHIPHELPAFEKVWHEPKDKILLGLAGSLGHMSDYLALLPTLRALFEKFPQLVLHIMGNETLPGIIGLPEDRMKYTKWGSMDDYFKFWRPLHIGIAPMLDTPYNRCRSDVKALEMSSCGVLPVLPRALPYENFLARTGAPAYSGFQELAAVISGFIANPASIRDPLKKCFDYIKAERIGAKRKERVELYRKHLPEKPGTFRWPQKIGSHEIIGKTQDQTREGIVLAEAQKLLTEKKTGEAFGLLQKTISENECLSGVALAELKILGATIAQGEWLARYETHRKLNPDDLRFPLLRTRYEKSLDGLMGVWVEIQSMLEKGSAAYREFFSAMVVGTLCEQIPKVAALVPVGEYFSNLFSHFATLHFTLAQSYERLGEDAQAARHCRWLVQAREFQTQNEKFYAQMDRAFLRTWLEGLEGRVAMKTAR